MNMTSDYIKTQWPLTFRFHPESEGSLIGLPYPYAVPCKKGNFQELYYWDTYFTSLGLATDGHADMVRHNCNNFLYLVKKFGFIPNGSRTFYLNRSQPPFLGAMIELTYQLFPDDTAWLSGAIKVLEEEIRFWDTYRRDCSGLYHYGSHATESIHREFYDFVMAERFKGIYPKINATCHEIALETLAEAESGWDFTPRFERQCNRCAAVDLNSLLYYDFNLLSLTYEKLGDLDQSRFWRSRTEEQQLLIEKYLWDESRGGYFDYLLNEKRTSRIFSAASGYVLWSRAASPGRAKRLRQLILKQLELDFGIAACENNAFSPMTLQWDFPNAWPPLQLIMIKGMENYGFSDDAFRLTEKFISCVDLTYNTTGELWEKYNALDGSVQVIDEYEMPSMLGWTAGCYNYCLQKQRKDQPL